MKTRSGDHTTDCTGVFVRVMAKQVRPWLMKPENVRAPTSAGKQTGVSQQNPSGTAAFAPQQSPDVRVQSKPVGRVTRRKAWQRVGAFMYGQSRPDKRIIEASDVVWRCEVMSLDHDSIGCGVESAAGEFEGSGKPELFLFPNLGDTNDHRRRERGRSIHTSLRVS